MGCNNLHRWVMSENTPSDDYKWVLEDDIQYPEILHDFQMIYPSYLKEWKLRKLKNLQPSCTKKIAYYRYEQFKTSIKSRISIEKSS